MLYDLQSARRAPRNRWHGLLAAALLAAGLHAGAPAHAAQQDLEAAVSAALRADDPAALQQAVAGLKAANPASPILAQGLARLVGMGQYELAYEALATMNAAIASNPNDLALKRTRALFVIGAPWHRLALKDLEEVITAEDPGATALQAFVDAAANDNSSDLGEARLSEALGRKQNRDPALLRARADVRYIRNDFKGALEDLDAANALSAATLNDHLLRYRIHTLVRQDPAALSDVDAMLALRAGDPGLQRMRAALLIRLGRSAEADAMLKQANR